VVSPQGVEAGRVPQVPQQDLERPAAVKFTFGARLYTTDGRCYVEHIRACDWEDALQQAAMLGVYVDGVLIEEGNIDGDPAMFGRVTRYNGELCPPCPLALREHPNIWRFSH